MNGDNRFNNFVHVRQLSNNNPANIILLFIAAMIAVSIILDEILKDFGITQ